MVKLLPPGKAICTILKPEKEHHGYLPSSYTPTSVIIFLIKGVDRSAQQWENKYKLAVFIIRVLCIVQPPFFGSPENGLEGVEDFDFEGGWILKRGRIKNKGGFRAFSKSTPFCS